MLIIADTLGSLGFSIDQRDERGLKATKGVKTAAKAKSVAELPQTVKVNFDRGRVELAVGSELRRKTGGALPQNQAMLIAHLIEAELNDEAQALRCRQSWGELQIQIADNRQSQSRKRILAWIALGVFVLLVVAAIIGAAIAFSPY